MLFWFTGSGSQPRIPEQHVETSDKQQVLYRLDAHPCAIGL